MTFRNDINGLRALSVALVVAFHAGLTGASGGYIGVDVFFVISGFLMTRIVSGGLATGTFSYGRFVRARAARIWPALGALLLAALLLGVFFLPPSDLLQMARQAGAAVVFASNHYFLAHSGYDTNGADGAWFLHTWSLSVEWQFYLVYPWLLMLIARFRRPPLAGAVASPTALVAGVSGLFALSLGYHLVESHLHPSRAFFLLPARAWEMAAGGLAFLAGREGRETRAGDDGGRAQAKLRAAASYAGVALIVLSALDLARGHVPPEGLGWRSLGPVAGAVLVLWSASPKNALLAPRAMQAIGRWSYSIYLWHWPLVVACGVGDLVRIHPIPARAAVIGGSGLLGGLSFRFVESAWRRPSKAREGLGLGKPLALLGLAGVAALVVVKTHGLEARMPPDATAARVVPAREADYFPDGCSNFQKRIADVRVCPIAKDDRRRVLVIGDSHAEHLYPWFAARSQVSVDFLTEAECPPIPNFERSQSGFHCLDYAALAWRTAGLPRYDTVIVSATFDIAAGGGPPYCHVDQTGKCVAVRDVTEGEAAIRGELRTAMRALLAAGKELVVLDGTPSAPVKVPQRLERERFWFGERRLSIDPAVVWASNEWIDRLYSELESVPGFHRLSLRPTLCSARGCRVFDEALGRPIYVDGSHFDPAWIVRNGDIFAPFVGLTRLPSINAVH